MEMQTGDRDALFSPSFLLKHMTPGNEQGGKMDELNCDTVATPPLIETIVLVPIITLPSTNRPKTKLMHAPLDCPTKPNSFCHKK